MPGPAAESSMLQIGTVANRLLATLIFAPSPRNYNGSTSRGYLVRTQGNTFFCGQGAWDWALGALGSKPKCPTKVLCNLGQGLSSPLPFRESEKKERGHLLCVRNPIGAILPRRHSWSHFTDEENGSSGQGKWLPASGAMVLILEPDLRACRQ